FSPRRRRDTTLVSDWSSDVCSSDLDDTAGDDARAIEAVGEKSEGNAGEREDRLQRDLQVRNLRACEREFVADQRDQRRNRLAVGKIYEINECQDREQADLIRRKRNVGLERHDGWVGRVRAPGE